jgi:hypothetical protein
MGCTCRVKGFRTKPNLFECHIKVVDGLRAKTATANAGFAGLTVSELQGLDWKDRYDGQWHVDRKVVDQETVHPRHRTRRAAWHAKAGSLHNTRGIREKK